MTKFRGTRLTSWVVSAMATALTSLASNAAESYTIGKIASITFAGESILIQMDSALPDNCIGTSYGWLMLPPNNKPMIAAVLSLWSRGALPSTQLSVYTSGIAGAYCQVNQIQPPVS